jgi:hypothetical protein
MSFYWKSWGALIYSWCNVEDAHNYVLFASSFAILLSYNGGFKLQLSCNMPHVGQNQT